MYDDIFLFVRLVDFGNYSSLAKSLKTSQPNISRKIQGLEEYLQVRLLHRNSRGFSLTSAGEDLYNRFKPYTQILNHDLESVWLSNQHDFAGTIHVAMAPTLAEELILPKISQFNARFPNAVLHLSMLASSFDLAAKGFDLAIGVRALAASDIITTQILRKFRLKLYAAANYPARHQLPVLPSDLATHKLIGGAIVKQKSSALLQNIVTLEEETVYLNSSINHDSVYQSINIAAGGDFIFSAPDFVMQNYLRDGSFIEILQDYILKELPCYLTQNLATQNLLTNEFAKFLIQCISEGI